MTISLIILSSVSEIYIAKFACIATIPEALNFSKGDEILIHSKDDGSGWWQATFKGRKGVVPKEYLKKKES